MFEIFLLLLVLVWVAAATIFAYVKKGWRADLYFPILIGLVGTMLFFVLAALWAIVFGGANDLARISFDSRHVLFVFLVITLIPSIIMCLRGPKDRKQAVRT